MLQQTADQIANTTMLLGARPKGTNPGTHTVHAMDIYDIVKNPIGVEEALKEINAKLQKRMKTPEISKF